MWRGMQNRGSYKGSAGVEFLHMGSNFVIPNKESSWRVTCRPDVHTHPRPPSSASHLPRPSKSSTSLPPPILPLPPTARPPELDCRGGPALLPSSSSSASPSLPR
jgi:hypothetical protein